MLNHAIFNKKNQCHYKSEQFLLYVKEEGRVEKDRIVKAIYLRFGFLKKQTKLLIVASTRAIVTNIGDAIIYEALSIDD